MRLWTLHPKYLDARGLVALWREALLARAVLKGKTEGYRNHPQLVRFRTAQDPLQAVNTYLRAVYEESERRGFSFDASKLECPPAPSCLEETEGQLLYEWKHLLEKLRERDPDRHEELADVERPDAHPMFRIVEGAVKEWEHRDPR